VTKSAFEDVDCVELYQLHQQPDNV